MKRGTDCKNEMETKHSGEWYYYFQFSVARKLGLYYVVGFILKSVFLHMSKMSFRERGCIDGQERNLVQRFL